MAAGHAQGGARPPEGYDPTQFPSFAVTVDIVILTIADGRLKVLLIQRAADPYAASWALPGGFKRPDETLDAAAARELAEETTITAPAHLAQFRAYGDPGRDPRTNVVTVGYVAVVVDLPEPEAATDAVDAELWSVDDVLAGRLPLAFDHLQIVTDAVAQVRMRIEDTNLALSFVDEWFTQAELELVYEAVWGMALPDGEFRRMLTSDGYVEQQGTGTAARYRCINNWAFGSPIRRQRNLL